MPNRLTPSILLLSLALCVSEAAAATSAEHLIAACEKPTESWGRVNGKVQKVGERLDSFCEGYLVSAFEVLQAQGAICNKDDAPRPEYLASVLRTYLDANRGQRKAVAAVVVREAFRRAFACK